MIIHVKPGRNKEPVFYEETPLGLPPVPEDKKELPGGGQRLPGVIVLGDILIPLWRFLKWGIACVAMAGVIFFLTVR